jgi:hypothetical protein
MAARLSFCVRNISNRWKEQLGQTSFTNYTFRQGPPSEEEAKFSPIIINHSTDLWRVRNGIESPSPLKSRTASTRLRMPLLCSRVLTVYRKLWWIGRLQHMVLVSKIHIFDYVWIVGKFNYFPAPFIQVYSRRSKSHAEWLIFHFFACYSRDKSFDRRWYATYTRLVFAIQNESSEAPVIHAHRISPAVKRTTITHTPSADHVPNLHFIGDACIKEIFLIWLSIAQSNLALETNVSTVMIMNSSVNK